MNVTDVQPTKVCACGSDAVEPEVLRSGDPGFRTHYSRLICCECGKFNGWGRDPRVTEETDTRNKEIEAIFTAGKATPWNGSSWAASPASATSPTASGKLGRRSSPKGSGNTIPLCFPMIVKPDFPDHWKTHLVVAEVDCETAACCILQLWGFCQQRRRWTFSDPTPPMLVARAFAWPLSRNGGLAARCRFLRWRQ